MNRIAASILLCWLGAAAGLLVAQPVPPAAVDSVSQSRIAITGGMLIDVETGESITDSLILINGERIEQVGKTRNAAIPVGVKVIDARGKWIIPGLTDMHAHLDVYNYRIPEIYLRYGVTTVRDVGGDVTPLRLLREDVNEGKKLGPRIYFAGMVLDGMPPVWNSSITLLADTPVRAESIVNFLADQGVDAIKVYNMITEPVLAQIVKTAHQRNLPVTGHVPRAITMTRAVEMGMDGLEHIRITAREILPPSEANDIDYLPVGIREPKLWSRIDLESREIKSIIALLARKQVYLDPTLVIDEVIYVDGMNAMKKDPNNRVLPPDLYEELVKQPDSPLMNVPIEMKETAAAAFKKRQKFVGMCQRANVPLLAGTDSYGLGKLIPGLSLHRELKLLTESGLTPIEALRAATITAARALHKENEIGSIKAGKFADLVLLDADPILNISNTRRIYKVIKNGRPVELETAQNGDASKH